MRFFEFSQGAMDLDTVNRFSTVLKNIIGRAASKKQPARYNWAGLNQMSKAVGDELSTDYETFKAMYDASPIIQSLVKNFNADAIVLNVPGAPDDDSQTDQSNDQQTSQDQVDQTADSAAAGQLAQTQKTPTPPTQG
jgi:hypothetical protein